MGQIQFIGEPKAPTQAQFDFIKSLIVSRDTSKIDRQIEVARAKAVEGTLTRADASVLIDYLKEQPRKHVEAPAPAAPVEPLTEGVYSLHGGTYKVVEGRNGLYAKVWENEEWVYAPGVVRSLTPAHKISAEEAARFGHLTGACVFCSRKLTDERSVSVGYGPVCAERVGLPWGEVAHA